jgi:hypothetical protein
MLLMSSATAMPPIQLSQSDAEWAQTALLCLNPKESARNAAYFTRSL